MTHTDPDGRSDPAKAGTTKQQADQPSDPKKKEDKKPKPPKEKRSPSVKPEQEKSRTVPGKEKLKPPPGPPRGPSPSGPVHPEGAPEFESPQEPSPVSTGPEVKGAPEPPYLVTKDVPLPLPEPVEELIEIMSPQLDKTPVITATTNGDHTGPAHPEGIAMDLRYPNNPDQVLRVAAESGARFGLDEKKHPSKKCSGDHIHLQVTPGRGGSRGDLPKVELTK